LYGTKFEGGKGSRSEDWRGNATAYFQGEQFIPRPSADYKDEFSRYGAVRNVMEHLKKYPHLCVETDN